MSFFLSLHRRLFGDWGGGVGDVNVHWTCTLTWCYATAPSLQVLQLRAATLTGVGGWGGGVGWGMLTFIGLAHWRDATLLHLLFKLYNYVMLRYCFFQVKHTQSQFTVAIRKRTGVKKAGTQQCDRIWHHVKKAIPKSVTSRAVDGHLNDQLFWSYVYAWLWRRQCKKSLWIALAEECPKKNAWNFRRAGKELKRWWKCCEGFRKRRSSVGLTVFYALDSWWISMRMCKNHGFLKKLISSVQMKWA